MHQMELDRRWIDGGGQFDAQRQRPLGRVSAAAWADELKIFTWAKLLLMRLEPGRLLPLVLLTAAVVAQLALTPVEFVVFLST